MLKDVDDVREFNGNPFLKPNPPPPQSRLFKLALSFKLIQSRQDSFLEFFQVFFCCQMQWHPNAGPDGCFCPPGSLEIH